MAAHGCFMCSSSIACQDGLFDLNSHVTNPYQGPIREFSGLIARTRMDDQQLWAAYQGHAPNTQCTTSGSSKAIMHADGVTHFQIEPTSLPQLTMMAEFEHPSLQNKEWKRFRSQAPCRGASGPCKFFERPRRPGRLEGFCEALSETFGRS